MSITYNIPHNAKLHKTGSLFLAPFFTDGKYNFNLADGNKNQQLVKLQKNSIYLIERLSFSANIREQYFLDSIEEIPTLTLRKSITKEPVLNNPINLLNFFSDSDIVAWTYSEKGNEFLTVDMNGILNQTAELVGKTIVKLFISFSIYEINSTVFYRRFRDVLGGREGIQVANG